MNALHHRRGHVVTFYSYKGGTGRSMALANVAWILAASGKRVLAIDWDLEAPGLHRYFQPFLIDKELRETDGLIDLVDRYACAAIQPLPDGGELAPDWWLPLADFDDFIVGLNYSHFPVGGLIDFLPAGRQTSTYALKVNAFNWQNFYDRLGGGGFLEAIKERAVANYDYVLIDSRTGVSDTSGICTVQMPDTLVVCFTYNNQSIKGAAAIAASAKASRAAADAARTSSNGSVLARSVDPLFRVLPIPTRADNGETERLKLRQALARDAFAELMDFGSATQVQQYWLDVEIQHQTFYSYEEVLTPFNDDPNDAKRILASFVRITSYISQGDVSTYRSPLSPVDLKRYLEAYAGASQSEVDQLAPPTRLRDTSEESLTQQAEACLNALDESGRALAMRGLTRLVRLEEGQFVAVPAPMADIPEVHRPAVLQLVSGRLLRFRRSYADGASQAASEPVVAFSDARTVNNWPRLTELVIEDRVFLGWRQQLQALRRSWENSQDRTALLGGSLLAEARRWLVARSSELNSGERNFIELSVKADEGRDENPAQSSGGRQLVLLCDGSNGNLSGRDADTHVVLLAELLRLFPDSDRLVYYDIGVGSPVQLGGTTVVDKALRTWQRVRGMAFAHEQYQAIAEGYKFLMGAWRPGDQIYVFGVSRGALVARSIAGMVNAFGIIEERQEGLALSLVSTYFSTPSPARSDIIAQAARLFGQGLTPHLWPEIHFVGVWDTVASIGLPPFGLKITSRPNLEGKQFRHVRQALALDEQRAQLLPRLYEQDNGSFTMKQGGTGDILQYWFRGGHADVGGGNAYPYSELSRAPFAWLVAEAIRCGLRVPMPAQHAGPITEGDICAVMPQLDPPGQPRLRARINSGTYAEPLWALTGLAVRDTAHAAVSDGQSRRVATQAHPSVIEWQAPFPERTAWQDGRDHATWARVIFRLLVLAMFMLAAGWAQLSPTGLLPPVDRLGDAMSANLAFQSWQLSLAPMDEWAFEALTFARPNLALLLDLGVIAAWAYLVSPWTSRAFARHAGLIGVGQPAPRWLNRLGWALPVAVAADLQEDLFSSLSLLAHGAAPDAPWVWMPRIAMTAASAVKWVALFSLAGLILSSFLRRSR